MSEFREMRRKRQQLSNEESVAILEKATAGTLALLGDGDYPYAVPISYVYHEGKLFFHSALAGHKVDAIRKCEKASFCVIEQDDVQPKKYTTFFRSVIAFGRIHTESISSRMNRRSWKQPVCLETVTTQTTMRVCKRKSKVASHVC